MSVLSQVVEVVINMRRSSKKRYTMNVLTWSKGGKHRNTKLSHLITNRTNSLRKVH